MVLDDRSKERVGGNQSIEEYVNSLPQVRAAEQRMSRPDATALQKHALFFDVDNDGQVSMRDIYNGCRAADINFFLSFLAAIIIGFGMSWVTQRRFFPLWFDVSHANWALHGSDARVYDRNGNVSDERFNDLWDRLDHAKTGYVTWSTLWNRIKQERHVLDLYGMTASFLEWGFLYWIAADHEKGLSREAVRRSFDGYLFLDLQKRALAREQLHRMKNEAIRNKRQQ